jgi:HSP20 family protein
MEGDMETTDRQDLCTVEQTETGDPDVLRITPDADVIERRDDFVITLDVPGADPARLGVTVDKDMLKIQAPVVDVARDGHEWVTREFRKREYQRAFSVSNDVDLGKIDAQLTDGVLTVTLAKAEPAVARRIQVRTTG